MKPGKSPSHYFRGKKAIVTGGSSGIGKEIARSLLRYGAVVTIVSDRLDKLQLALEEFKAEGLCANAIQCDLSKSEDIENLFDRVASDFGAPDIIINNAGFAVYRTFEQSSLDEIGRLIEVNLLGAMRLTRSFLPELIRRRSGAIVNMASIAGTMAITPNGTYCAAKHGLVAWSECLRYELARFNIQVNVICPGRVLTPFFDHETFQLRAARPETGYTLPLSVVVERTLMAIIKNQFLTYIPRTLGVLSRLKAALPFMINPLYERLMMNRIDSIYNQK
jgi:short-subunit dehydrogenase